MQRLQRRALATTERLLRIAFNAANHVETTYLPTFHFQGALPRLPIPELNQSLDKYVKSLQALEGHPNVTKADIDRAIEYVEEFRNGDGPQLHESLLASDAANSHTSFYYAAWSDMYLSDRRPLPVNYNPLLAWKELPNEALNKQSTRAAQICWAAAKYYLTLADGHLQPAVFHMGKKPDDNTEKLSKALPKWRLPETSLTQKYGVNGQALRYLPFGAKNSYPLDMSQIDNLFFSTRIPCPGKDQIKKADESMNHVILLINGRFYTVDVLVDINGTRSARDATMIMNDIDAIVADARQKGPAEHPVATLTNVDRDMWTEARQRLIDLGNTDALDEIDGALFAMSLDDYSGETDEDIVGQFLWGPGHNRWVDKSFSVLITEDGKCGLNFEHAWGDGACVLAFFDKVHEQILEHNTIKPDHKPYGGAEVNEVHFVLDDGLKDTIKRASGDYHDHTKDLVISYARDYDTTRKWMNENKIGPDGFLQLSLQIAHNELHGWPCATYESASTCAYQHGRTETIRPCTSEARELCALYANGAEFEEPAMQRKIDLKMRTAIKAHNSGMVQCLSGAGFDRHLFGLRLEATKAGQELPKFVQDDTFRVMNHFRMSTSTLNSPHVQSGGFGPVVEDGYALGYMVYDDYIGVVAISKPCNGVDSAAFTAKLGEVWTNLAKCVMGAKNNV